MAANGVFDHEGSTQSSLRPQPKNLTAEAQRTQRLEAFLCVLVRLSYGFHDSSKPKTNRLIPFLRMETLTLINPNRKIFEARKRETAALGAGEKLVLEHPLAATIGDSARCMQNLEKVLFTGPKTSDTVTFICD